MLTKKIGKDGRYRPHLVHIRARIGYIAKRIFLRVTGQNSESGKSLWRLAETGLTLAIKAFSATDDRQDDDSVSFLYFLHLRTDILHESDSFMTHDVPLLHCGVQCAHIYHKGQRLDQIRVSYSMQLTHVKVRAADSAVGDFDNCILGSGNHWFRNCIDLHVPRSLY
jgi:hypothetical protein